MLIRNLAIIIPLLCLGVSCDILEGTKAPSGLEEVEGAEGGGAVVQSVSVSGSENSYTFNVKVKSPDTGCGQYADWWEVIDAEEKLIYRRILLHSHVNEQPFRRTGGPVAIAENKLVYVRAHMNNSGYGTQVMSGTVRDGFKATQLESDFAKELLTQEPLPKDCDF